MNPKRNKEFFIATLPEKRKAILDHIINNCTDKLAVDTETTSNNVMTCKLVGISFSFSPTEAFYIPTQYYNVNQQRLISLFSDIEFEEFKLAIYKILVEKKLKLIMHNAPFDINVIRNTLNIDCLDNLYMDTMTAKHTIDEQRPHGLKPVLVKYFGEEWDLEQQDLKESVLANGGSWNKDIKDMYMGDLHILGNYACNDAMGTYLLSNFLEKKLEEVNLTKFYFEDEVLPVTKAITDMIYHGVKIDVPYFLQLKQELEKESIELEKSAHTNLMETYPKVYQGLERDILDKSIPIKMSGLFFEKLYLDFDLPVCYNKKTNRASFTASILAEVEEDYPTNPLIQWKLGKISDKDFLKKEKERVSKIQKQLFFERNPEEKYIINLRSTKQLGELLYNRLGEEAFKTTEKNNASVDTSTLDHFANKYKFVEHLTQLRKVEKILSTYVIGVLTSEVNGVIHPSWISCGTDSGRFSCKNPNFQNIPRDDKRIKKGIIPRDGYVFIGTDYSQLEPRCFANCANEDSLINAYKNGEDIYGRAAVDLMKLKCSPNEVKNLYPKKRQTMKTLLLAITYGAKKWKASKITGMSLEESENFISNYFKTYKNLEKFILASHGTALRNGEVKSEAGRIRRFYEIKKLKNSKLRQDIFLLNKLLNISVNFRIQSLAASIVNRSMIAIIKDFKKYNIDGNIILQCHDELLAEVIEKDAEKASMIIKNRMENTYKLKVPLLAEPKIAYNYADCK